MSDEQILIHVRFAPDGAVIEIGERPGTVPPDTWFRFLAGKIGEQYQPLSGGRGVFRAGREALEGFKTAVAAT